MGIAHCFDLARIALPTPGVEPRKTLRSACANRQKGIAADLHAYFEVYLAETEPVLANNDQRDFYKHLKSRIGMEGTKARSVQFIRDEDDTL